MSNATANNHKRQHRDRHRSRDINTVPVQNFILIWLDTNIDESHTDFRHSLSQLTAIVTSINTFTDTEQCIDFLQHAQDIKIFLIVSGSLGQTTVPRIHNQSNLDTIFVFCADRDRPQQWAKQWSKIAGVVTKINELCQLLKHHTQLCERNSISFTLANNDLNHLPPSFMYTQLIKETFIEMDFDEVDRTTFITFCREWYRKSHADIAVINDFERRYHEHSPIWWYTRGCFAYHLLNRALRTQDMEVLIKIGFFLRDLHHQIEQLHHQQRHQLSNHPISLYRGQGLHEKEFENIKTNKNGLLAFNNFLSTSHDEAVSMRFASQSLDKPDHVGILFCMKINPSVSSTPFAAVDKVGYYGDKEKEILFSMHTVFRIGEIKALESQLWSIDLTLSNDDEDQALKHLTENLRVDTACTSGWKQLARILIQMGENRKAEEIYNTLLTSVSINDDVANAYLYHQLAYVNGELGEYWKALDFYHKSLDIDLKSHPPNHPQLATGYHNMAMVHEKMGEYSKALDFFNESLDIRLKSLPPNHPQLATSYGCLGSVHDKMGEYSKALDFFNKSLDIRLKSLPPNHPHLATSYSNIGGVHDKMGEYSKALDFYHKSLNIYLKSLPPNHPHLATGYACLGSVHDKMGEYSKALDFYHKSLDIRLKSLPPNHPHLATSYSNIGGVHSKMGEYSKALDFYHKSLDIYLKSLPPNHPHLATSYNNIGLVHDKMGEYSKALDFYHKSLDIYLKSLPPNHPHLATSYNNIGVVHDSMGEYSKALEFSNQSLDIFLESLPPNHPYLAVCYRKMGVVYRHLMQHSKALQLFQKAIDIYEETPLQNQPNTALVYTRMAELQDEMGNHSKAMEFCEKALYIQEKCLPTNHPDVALTLNTLGSIKRNMGDLSKALDYHEKALKMRQSLLPASHPDIAWTHRGMGAAYEKMGDYKKAFEALREAIRIGRQSLRPEHPHLKLYRRELEKVETQM